MEIGNSQGWRPLIELALAEDLGRGDATTRALFPEMVSAKAEIRTRQPIIAAGMFLLPEVFHRIDPSLRLQPAVQDGEAVQSGGRLAVVEGDGRGILAGERVALNFLQRLSGIATLTARYVAALKNSKTRLLDTRKTAPGWRVLEKFAVRAGGGTNHRFGLDDGLLIKDNHLALIGGIGPALAAARRKGPHHLKIIVETETMEQVQEAVRHGADGLLLDNMTPAAIRDAVEWVKGRAMTEASGGISLENIAEVAASGVDFISVGALTHSAPAVDIHLALLPHSG